MSTSDTRRSVRFADQVAADSSITLTKDVEQDATIEQLSVRIYRGAELSLHITPFKKVDGRRFELIDFRGKQFVDGDGDHFEFPLSEDVEENDTIGVEVVNESTDYAYDFSADVVLDREGGTTRSLTSFIGGLF